MVLSAIIVAKNEEQKLAGCLESLNFAGEIILVDDYSGDKTAQIAKRFNARIYKSQGNNYSDRKNNAFRKARGEWILSLDADERVTPSLRDEINKLTQDQISKYNAYAIPRRNYIFGKEFKYGGQWPDYVVRLFRRESFIEWKGVLHEQPEIKGELGYLKNPLLHLKHDNISEMVVKTNKWSEVEAKLMLDAGHPPMNIRRFMSGVLREFWVRIVRQKSFLDGSEGVIYAIYQVFSRFLSYAKLWEMQIK